MKLQSRVKGFALMGRDPSPKLPHPGVPMAIASLSVPVYSSGGDPLDLAAIAAVAEVEANAEALLLVRPTLGSPVVYAPMPVINDALRVSNADLSPGNAAALAMLEVGI